MSDNFSPLATIGSLLQSGAIVAHKDGNHGSQYPRIEQFGALGVPFLTAKLLADGRVDIANAPRLAVVHANKLRLGSVESGDVLLSHNATIGRVAIVPPYDGRLLIGTSLSFFRLNRSAINPRYLAAYFSGEYFQNQLRAVMSHTTRNQVPISAQRKLSVVLPPIAVQEAIASLLGAFDDRIALLRSANSTLEAIAQALFNSWFVDFDPVHAKQQGLAPVGMNEATAELFPSSFMESTHGQIPDGWQVGVLSNFALLRTASINPLRTPERQFDHFSLPAFDCGQMPIKEFGAKIKSNKTSVSADAVLLSKLNPHIPRVWLPEVCEETAVCSTEFLVFVPIGGVPREFVFGSFSTVAFRERMRQLVTGTSNSHQRVKPEAVSGTKVILPKSELLRKYGAIARPLLSRVAHNRVQAQSLTSLRDTLLPRLISGQLRLPEAEAQLADAIA